MTQHPLDEKFLDQLRARIIREVDARRIPAAQFAFAHDGEVVMAESFGGADDDTLFNVFSATKALVAGAAWQLIGEGLLSADTRVIELLPGFGAEGTTSEWMSRITLANLLTHTSGFPTAPMGPPRWDTPESRSEVYSRWRCTWEPGTRFEYHPTAAHWVIADMIGKVERADHREVLNKRIIEPLGLSQISFGQRCADLEVAELVAVGATPTAAEIKELFGIDIGDFDLGEVTPEILVAFNEPAIRAVGVPGAGAVATASGLALYYQALLHNPGSMWTSGILTEGTEHILCTLPDPMTRVPANRTLGLIRSGDDGMSALRGMGPTVSQQAFGHNGAGGQIVWADPETGYSFAFTNSAIERNFISEAKRTLSIASKAGLATRPTAPSRRQDPA